MTCDNDNEIGSCFESAVKALARARRFDAPVYVTRPNLPTLEAYMRAVAPAWERRWLTNDGALHAQLEAALAMRFDVPCFRLFCNGTVALLAALQALGLEDGEVITTPFTFPATVNALHWRRLRPVFCDIDPKTCNLDPAGIAALITPDTRAILPVHVFGTPCDVDAIQAVADAHGLPVIYDAAHAFDVEYKGKSILQYGTMSMLSFHATKLFTTAEGGALAAPNTVIASEAKQSPPDLNERLRLLKNFGIADENTVIAPGVNGKMSELHAALGLTQLESVADEIANRRRIAMRYNERLADLPGLTTPVFDTEDVKHNYAYYPLRVNGEIYGMDRDALHAQLKLFNIYARRYFHPLCSTFAWCRVEPGCLPVAEAAARETLCLPLYGALSPESAATICDVITQLGTLARETA